MTQASEKEMIKIARREVDRFAKEWMATPYAWESETDVHAELYITINATLETERIIQCFGYAKLNT